MRFSSLMADRRAIAASTLLVLTGCGHYCLAVCTDQTQLQNAYVEYRDQCRELAELKAGMPAGTDTAAVADKSSKEKLVTLFADCMKNKGFTVPGGEDKDKKKDAAPPVVAAAAGAGSPKQLAEGNPPIPAPSTKGQDARLKRAADCAFARQAADVSVNARKRAEACDIECRDLLKMAPEAPRPAACPDK